MTTSGVDLRYLWAVRYTDGADLVQTHDDVSAKDPARSAWHDVDLERVDSLAILSRETGGMVVGLDLRSGFFVVGGVKVAVGDNPPHDPAAGARRPLCFRQIQRKQEISIGGPLWEIGYDGVVVRYCIGWEATTADGRVHRAIFGVY